MIATLAAALVGQAPGRAARAPDARSSLERIAYVPAFAPRRPRITAPNAKSGSSHTDRVRAGAALARGLARG